MSKEAIASLLDDLVSMVSTADDELNKAGNKLDATGTAVDELSSQITTVEHSLRGAGDQLENATVSLSDVVTYTDDIQRELEKPDTEQLVTEEELSQIQYGIGKLTATLSRITNRHHSEEGDNG